MSCIRPCFFGLLGATNAVYTALFRNDRSTNGRLCFCKATPPSKANDTKTNVIAPVNDDAVMQAVYHLADYCRLLQFQLKPLLFVHLVLVSGFWAMG